MSNVFDMRPRRATYHAFNANDPRFISVVHDNMVDFSYLDYTWYSYQDPNGPPSAIRN